MEQMTQALKLRNRIDALCRENRVKYGMLAVIIERTPQTTSARMQHPETFRVDELIRIAKFFHMTVKERVGGKE